MERIECEHGGLKRQCLICELKAEVARLNAENERLRDTCGYLSERIEVWRGEAEARRPDEDALRVARAAVAVLAKNSERYLWLEDNIGRIVMTDEEVDGVTSTFVRWVLDTEHHEHCLFEAIDAAIAYEATNG